MPTTPAAKAWPKLSESLTGPKDPRVCQSCGGGKHLGRWQECDETDTPTSAVLVLCRDCDQRLLAPHPRLYLSLDPNAPCPGSMELCVDCVFRAGVTCTQSDLRANGGLGLAITCATPIQVHLQRRGPGPRCSWHTIYPHAPSACAGRRTEPVAAPTADR
jgi:hypothetical protein